MQLRGSKIFHKHKTSAPPSTPVYSAVESRHENNHFTPCRENPGNLILTLYQLDRRAIPENISPRTVIKARPKYHYLTSISISCDVQSIIDVKVHIRYDVKDAVSMYWYHDFVII